MFRSMRPISRASAVILKMGVPPRRRLQERVLVAADDYINAFGAARELFILGEREVRKREYGLRARRAYLRE